MAANLEIPFQDPMNFGMGIDSLTLRPCNTVAVIATPLKTVEGTGESQTVEFSLINAETTEAFEETFSVSAEASASYGFFAGGSASFNFGKKHKVHSYSRFLIIRVTVTNAFKQIATPTLNPDTSAISKLQSGDQNGFQAEFGDQFVLGIKQGYYLVDKRCTTCSMADKENLSCPPIFKPPHSLTKPQPAKPSKQSCGRMAPYALAVDHLIASVRLTANPLALAFIIAANARAPIHCHGWNHFRAFQSTIEQVVARHSFDGIKQKGNERTSAASYA